MDTEGDLIGLIYDAGLGVQPWLPALDLMRRRLGVGLVILTSRDDAVGPGYIHFGMSGGREAEFRPWGEYYGSRDPRKIYIDAEPIGSVYTEFAEMPDSVYHRNEIFADFFRPRGIGKCCGVTLMRDATRDANLALRLTLGLEFTGCQIATMRRLAPHFTRAFQVRRQKALAETAAARRMLDCMPAAAFVLSRRAAVLHMNPRAAALLHRRADVWRMTGQDVLSVVQPGGQTQFIRALSQTLAAQDGKPPPPIFRLNGPGGPLAVMMAPATNHFPATEAAGTVCMFVADPGEKPLINPTLLVQEFDLTAAEAQVVAALAGGAAVKQIAAGRQVSPNTVLMQIKHVLAKTNTHSQTQLVSAVLRGLAATAPARGWRD
jgi:DNA-binding CsgD family transcriptional regulator/PAS domain-containing protein